MESWQDQGIVLKARPHGEAGAVVTLLTEGHGRHAGYVPGGQSSRHRGAIERGNLVAARWRGQGPDQLGGWSFELEHNYAVAAMDDPLRLAAMASACALCDAALPEREGHPGLFHGLHALLKALEGDDAPGTGLWGPAYIMWEIAFLRELGFGLDLTRCVAGGDPMTLEWVSPKSGMAVSKEKGAPYADRLLPLPDFLKPVRSGGDADDVLTGLRLTGYFLEYWAFAQHTTGVPDDRRTLLARVERAIQAA